MFGGGRVNSDVNLNVVDDASITSNTAWFLLAPGLYPVSWAFGCWHGREMDGSGRMTLMITHAGQLTPLSAQPGEILRQDRGQPAPPPK